MDNISKSTAAAMREYFGSRPKLDVEVISKVLDEHKPVLESIGLSGTKMGDFYKELQLTKFNDEKLYFGESLANLASNNDIYARVAGTTATDYTKQRAQVLGELIAVFEKAKETGNPNLLISFLNMTKDAAKTAGKASVHEDEVFKSSQHAVSGDSGLSGMLRSEPRSFVYDPNIFEPTLKELKERYEHLSQINAVESTNIDKHGLAGGLRDFGWMGVLQTALAGWVLSRKVPGIDLAGEPITKILKDGSKVVVTTPAACQWLANIGRAGKATGNGIYNGSGYLLKNCSLSAITEGIKNGCTALKNVPGIGKYAALAAVVLTVGIGKFICYSSENPDWAKPIVDTAKATPGFLYNSVGYAAMFSPVAIPDFGKLYGRSWFDTNNLNELRHKVQEPHSHKAEESHSDKEGSHHMEGVTA